jgi:hypothetical protein
MSTQIVSVQQVTSEELVKIGQSIHNLTLEEVEVALSMLHAAKEESLSKPIEEKVKEGAEEAWESFKKTLAKRHQSRLEIKKANLQLNLAIEAIVNKYVGTDSVTKVTLVLEKCVRDWDFTSAKSLYEKMEQGEDRDIIRMIVHSFKLKSREISGEGSPSGSFTLEKTIKQILDSATPKLKMLNQDLVNLGIISL